MEHHLVLQQGSTTLRPLSPADAAGFRAIVDEQSWAGMAAPLPASDAAMAAHLRELVGAPATLAFAVEHDGQLVGRTCFYDLVDGLKVEIGNTIYSRRVWGGTVNPTAKLLLLEHAFEVFGVGRVALRCDHRNTRSHRAIERLGARFEGTLRHFRPAADATVADVDYFSILRDEWPQVRSGLQARLGLEGAPRPSGRRGQGGATACSPGDHAA